MTERKERITAKLSIHHENFRDPPTSVGCVGHCFCETVGEEPYQRRRLIATEEWSELSYGHLDNPGMYIIENLEGRPQRPYTQEELQASFSKYLLVSFTRRVDLEGSFEIPPGLALPIKPADPEARLFIKSPNGDAQYKLTVFPR